MSDIDVYKEWLGIPEDKRPPDLYDLLRLVQFEDDAEKINEHYKKLNAHVRKYATGAYSVRSQELLNELAKAMLCLTDSERKREYDESLGREFDDDDEGRKPLLKILAEAGTIDRSQISEIEDFADARGLSHCDAVVQMKLVEREAATRALSQELGIPFIDLEDMLPDDSVLDRVPKNLVKRHSFLPLFEDDGVLLVACADEPEPELEDAIRMRFGIPDARWSGHDTGDQSVNRQILRSRRAQRSCRRTVGCINQHGQRQEGQEAEIETQKDRQNIGAVFELAT